MRRIPEFVVAAILVLALSGTASAKPAGSPEKEAPQVVKIALFFLNHLDDTQADFLEGLRSLLGDTCEVEQTSDRSFVWRAKSDVLADGFAKGELEFQDGHFVAAELKRPRPGRSEVATIMDMYFRPDGVVCGNGNDDCSDNAGGYELRVTLGKGCMLYSGSSNSYAVLPKNYRECSSRVQNRSPLPDLERKYFACHKYCRKIQDCGSPSGQRYDELSLQDRCIKQCVENHQQRNQDFLKEFNALNRFTDKPCDEFLGSARKYYDDQRRNRN